MNQPRRGQRSQATPVDPTAGQGVAPHGHESAPPAKVVDGAARLRDVVRNIPRPWGERDVPTPVIRPATADDADDMARLIVTVWRETYVGQMPDEVLENLEAQRTAASLRERLTPQSRGRLDTYQVAEVNGKIVGMAHAGPTRDSCGHPRIELTSINVLRAHHGSGVGQLLLDAVLDKRAASLWVLPGNKRAQAFYRRNGFRLDGAQKRHATWGVIEVRMVRGAGWRIAIARLAHRAKLLVSPKPSGSV